MCRDEQTCVGVDLDAGINRQMMTYLKLSVVISSGRASCLPAVSLLDGSCWKDRRGVGMGRVE